MLEKSGLDVERRGRRRRGGGETVLRGDEHVFLSDTDVNEVEAMVPALKASAGEFIPTKLKRLFTFSLVVQPENRFNIPASVYNSLPLNLKSLYLCH